MPLRPDFRTSLGIAACGVYFWRVQDPKGSYAVFYDATDWLTTAISGLFVSDGAVVGFIRNAINLVLLDQVEGFLIGIAFVSLLSGLLWPFKACGRALARKVRSLRGKGKPPPPAGTPAPGETLELTEVISRPRADS
jgi:hypothetical protein